MHTRHRRRSVTCTTPTHTRARTHHTPHTPTPHLHPHTTTTYTLTTHPPHKHKHRTLVHMQTSTHRVHHARTPYSHPKHAHVPILKSCRINQLQLAHTVDSMSEEGTPREDRRGGSSGRTYVPLSYYSVLFFTCISFHCDEALAVFILKRTQQFKNACKPSPRFHFSLFLLASPILLLSL